MWRHPLANRSVNGFDQKTLLLSSIASSGYTDRNRMLKPQLTICSSCKPLICWEIAFWKKDDDDLGSNVAFGKMKRGNAEVKSMKG